MQKQNRYRIQKTALGVASVIVGSLLLGNVSTQQVSAAEGTIEPLEAPTSVPETQVSVESIEAAPITDTQTAVDSENEVSEVPTEETPIAEPPAESAPVSNNEATETRAEAATDIEKKSEATPVVPTIASSPSSEATSTAKGSSMIETATPSVSQIPTEPVATAAPAVSASLATPAEPAVSTASTAPTESTALSQDTASAPAVRSSNLLEAETEETTPETQQVEAKIRLDVTNLLPNPVSFGASNIYRVSVAGLEGAAYNNTKLRIIAPREGLKNFIVSPMSSGAEPVQVTSTKDYIFELPAGYISPVREFSVPFTAAHSEYHGENELEQFTTPIKVAVLDNFGNILKEVSVDFTSKRYLPAKVVKEIPTEMTMTQTYPTEYFERATVIGTYVYDTQKIYKKHLSHYRIDFNNPNIGNIPPEEQGYIRVQLPEHFTLSGGSFTDLGNGLYQGTRDVLKDLNYQGNLRQEIKYSGLAIALEYNGPTLTTPLPIEIKASLVDEDGNERLNTVMNHSVVMRPVNTTIKANTSSRLTVRISRRPWDPATLSYHYYPNHLKDMEDIPLFEDDIAGLEFEMSNFFYFTNEINDLKGSIYRQSIDLPNAEELFTVDRLHITMGRSNIREITFFAQDGSILAQYNTDISDVLHLNHRATKIEIIYDKFESANDYPMPVTVIMRPSEDVTMEKLTKLKFQGEFFTDYGPFSDVPSRMSSFKTQTASFIEATRTSSKLTTTLSVREGFQNTQSILSLMDLDLTHDESYHNLRLSVTADRPVTILSHDKVFTQIIKPDGSVELVYNLGNHADAASALEALRKVRQVLTFKPNSDTVLGLDAGKNQYPLTFTTDISWDANTAIGNVKTVDGRMHLQNNITFLLVNPSDRRIEAVILNKETNERSSVITLDDQLVIQTNVYNYADTRMNLGDIIIPLPVNPQTPPLQLTHLVTAPDGYSVMYSTDGVNYTDVPDNLANVTHVKFILNQAKSLEAYAKLSFELPIAINADVHKPGSKYESTTKMVESGTETIIIEDKTTLTTVKREHIYKFRLNDIALRNGEKVSEDTRPFRGTDVVNFVVTSNLGNEYTTRVQLDYYEYNFVVSFDTYAEEIISTKLDVESLAAVYPNTGQVTVTMTEPNTNQTMVVIKRTHEIPQFFIRFVSAGDKQVLYHPLNRIYPPANIDANGYVDVLTMDQRKEYYQLEQGDISREVIANSLGSNSLYTIMGLGVLNNKPEEIFEYGVFGDFGYRSEDNSSFSLNIQRLLSSTNPYGQAFVDHFIEDNTWFLTTDYDQLLNYLSPMLDYYRGSILEEQVQTIVDGLYLYNLYYANVMKHEKLEEKLSKARRFALGFEEHVKKANRSLGSFVYDATTFHFFDLSDDTIRRMDDSVFRTMEKLYKIMSVQLSSGEKLDLNRPWVDMDATYIDIIFDRLDRKDLQVLGVTNTGKVIFQDPKVYDYSTMTVISDKYLYENPIEVDSNHLFTPEIFSERFGMALDDPKFDQAFAIYKNIKIAEIRDNVRSIGLPIATNGDIIHEGILYKNYIPEFKDLFRNITEDTLVQLEKFVHLFNNDQVNDAISNATKDHYIYQVIPDEMGYLYKGLKGHQYNIMPREAIYASLIFNSRLSIPEGAISEGIGSNHELYSHLFNILRISPEDFKEKIPDDFPLPINETEERILNRVATISRTHESLITAAFQDRTKILYFVEAPTAPVTVQYQNQAGHNLIPAMRLVDVTDRQQTPYEVTYLPEALEYEGKVYFLNRDNLPANMKGVSALDPINIVIQYDLAEVTREEVRTYPIPYEIETYLNIELQPGTSRIIVAGQYGEMTEYRVTRLLNGQPVGEPSLIQVETKPKVNEVIEVGLGITINFNIIDDVDYVAGLLPDHEFGIETVTVSGVAGLEKITQIDGQEPTVELIQAAEKKVITVGVQKIQVEVVPFNTVRILDISMEPGSPDKVSIVGIEGQNEQLITYGLDSTTGVITQAPLAVDLMQAKPAIDQVILYAPVIIDYQRRTVESPDLLAGETRRIQEGKTGLLDVDNNQVLIAAIDEIIEVGTKAAAVPVTPTPVTPEEPKAPEVPATPVTPEEPEAPEAPVTQVTPEETVVPDKPEVPDKPIAQEQSETSKTSHSTQQTIEQANINAASMLPNTGESTDTKPVIGAMMTLLVGMGLITTDRRRKTKKVK